MDDLSRDLVDSLVDPETREPVRQADPRQLARLHELVAFGKARRSDGGELPKTFDGAFVTQDGKRVYLVVDGIPNFLMDERLELDEAL